MFSYSSVPVWMINSLVKMENVSVLRRDVTTLRYLCQTSEEYHTTDFRSVIILFPPGLWWQQRWEKLSDNLFWRGEILEEQATTSSWGVKLSSNNRQVNVCPSKGRFYIPFGGFVFYISWFLDELASLDFKLSLSQSLIFFGFPVNQVLQLM